ncbi:YceI family protein [bacterium]|jgi:hypothetical protein|nr:YceI family protein [bacterium]
MLNLLILLFLSVGSAQAEPLLKVVPETSKALVRVKYTLGTYVIPNTQVLGFINLVQTQSSKQKLKSAEVSFLIAGFKSNDTTLDCHLRESLGLDYTQSDFPNRHVCSQDRLPAEGKNAVVFDQIQFRTLDSLDVDLSKMSEEWVNMEVPGSWTLHGVRREAPAQVKIQKTSKGYRVLGKHSFSLKDFGVVVKKFLFISVQDQVEAEWDVQFAPEEKVK